MGNYAARAAWLLALGITLAPAAVPAQTASGGAAAQAEAPGESAGIQEVVVTARRRAASPTGRR